MNRELLLKEILFRQKKAIKYIIRRHFKESEVDDLYQEVCIDLFKKIGREHDDLLARWNTGNFVAVVVKNFCLSQIRKSNAKKRIKTKNFDEDDAFLKAVHGSSYVDSDELDFFKSTKKINLIEALSRLSDRDQEFIMLRYFQKKSILEINDKMGVTNSSVYIDRAEKKLKRIIGTIDDDESFEIIDGLAE
jgi:RNA polymerase sigma factor (sigma-70 family)